MTRSIKEQVYYVCKLGEPTVLDVVDVVEKCLPKWLAYLEEHNHVVNNPELLCLQHYCLSHCFKA